MHSEVRSDLRLYQHWIAISRVSSLRPKDVWFDFYSRLYQRPTIINDTNDFELRLQQFLAGFCNQIVIVCE